MSIDDCRVVKLRKIGDVRGNLTVIEGAKDIPFEIKRIYYIYDVPAGEYRGAHAHRKLEQLMVAVSGSLDVSVDDGMERKTFSLNRPYEGFYIPKMTWRDMGNFSSGSVCLVLASEFYEESDYLRDYDEFLRIAKGEKNGNQTG